MNKKEVLELRRRFKKEDVSFNRLCGCYVDGNHNKVCKFNGQFLNLDEDEFYKYLEIASKTLSGTLDNNLLELSFPLAEEEVGGRQQILMALRETELKDEALLDTYYDLIIDHYEHVGNYLILLFYDVYDVLTRTKDNFDLEDSEESFRYLICSICPVELSKPGLGYREEEQRIGARLRDWVVGVPETGFLFPAFNDRSTDIHNVLFYTKNTKEPHTEFMSDILGCGIAHTATEHKMAFHSIVRNALGAEDEHTEDILTDLQQKLSDYAEEYAETHDESDGAFTLDKDTLSKAMEECLIPEAKADKIEHSLEEVFGGKLPPAGHVIDTKALEHNAIRLEKLELEADIQELSMELDSRLRQLEEKDSQLQEKDSQLLEKDSQLQEKDSQLLEKDSQLLEKDSQLQEKDSQLQTRSFQLTEKQEEIDHYTAEMTSYDVVLHVKPQKASQIKSQMIDGKRYLMIPMEENENAAINGVSTTM